MENIGAKETGFKAALKKATDFIGAPFETLKEMGRGKAMLTVGAIGAGTAYVIDKLVGPKDPGETMGEYMTRRKSTVSEYLRYYYKNVNPLASEEEVANFVATNTPEYNKAQGGRIGYALGLPGTPQMASDGMEYDMSQNGGFQALGAQEGKDDIKANLAKNEFVFTADAVRGAGDGDVEIGAQRMYDTMKRLEGRVA